MFQLWVYDSPPWPNVKYTIYQNLHADTSSLLALHVCSRRTRTKTKSQLAATLALSHSNRARMQGDVSFHTAIWHPAETFVWLKRTHYNRYQGITAWQFLQKVFGIENEGKTGGRFCLHLTGLIATETLRLINAWNPDRFLTSLHLVNGTRAHQLDVH